MFAAYIDIKVLMLGINGCRIRLIKIKNLLQRTAKGFLERINYKNDNNSSSNCINVFGSAIIVTAKDLVLGNIRSK